MSNSKLRKRDQCFVWQHQININNKKNIIQMIRQTHITCEQHIIINILF